MLILGIETSCDETALALVEVKKQGKSDSPNFRVLKNIIASQIEVHKEYGGVVPGLAKREHRRNLVKVFYKTLSLNYGMTNNQFPISKQISNSKLQNIEKVLERYPEMVEEFKKKIIPLTKPNIDLIAVTHGPGLEPALWVGINFARALSVLWDIPLIGVDHMEGHIAVNLLAPQEVNEMSNVKYQMSNVDTASAIAFPAIALAVSGGHTQLILIKDWLDYKLLGETLDDAAGEAFDKIARLLGLPFPGGPHIEKLAKDGNPNAFDFPRPLLRQNSKEQTMKNKYNFSFSGLKTAVLYEVRNQTSSISGGLTSKLGKSLTPKVRANIAASFQQAVIDTLVIKTIKAAKEYGAKTIMLAGGVAANQALKIQLGDKIKKELHNVNYLVPELRLATDNGVMIAIAGYLRYANGESSDWKTLEADSNKLITD